MRAHDGSNLLLLFGLLAMAAAPAAAGAEPGTAPSAEELETDDLPPWAQADLDGEPPPEAQARMLQDYGAGIPDPEDVMAGRRPQAAAPSRETAPPPETATAVQFEDFRSELSPHGRWVDTPEYGSVFVPARQREVGGWRPYLYGQWAWTSYGWTWVSDEPFGWATYHYGRWAHRPALGWVWVPGYTWGPAWVAWRHGEGAVGWAPLYPGYVTWTTSYPYYGDHWVFVGPTFFYGHPIHRHWYRDRSDYYYGRSAWARNWRAGGRGHVYTGPPVRRIEHSTRGRVRESRVIAVSSSRRGEVMSGRSGQSAGDVRIYRPTNRGAVRGPETGRRSGVAPQPLPRGNERRGSPGSRGTDRRDAPAPQPGSRGPDRRTTAPRPSDRQVGPDQSGPRPGSSSQPARGGRDDRRAAPAPRSSSQVQPTPRQQAPAQRQVAPSSSSLSPSRSSAPSSSRPSSSPSLRSSGSAGGLRPAPTVRTQSGSSRVEVKRPNLHR